MKKILISSILLLLECNATNYIDIFKCTLADSKKIELSVDNNKVILMQDDNKEIFKKKNVLYNQNNRYQSIYMTLKLGNKYILVKNFDKEFSDSIKYNLIVNNGIRTDCLIIEKDNFKLIPHLFRCDKTDALGCK